MVTPVTPDVIYMGRPKWSVAHHLSAAGVPSPSKTADARRLSKRHQKSVIAASITTGIVFAAIYFAFVKVQHVARLVHDTAQPWATSAVEAQEKVPAVGNLTPDAQTQPAPQPVGQSNTVVTINGQPVTVPEDGAIHKTYINGDSRSTVDIRIQQNSGP